MFDITWIGGSWELDRMETFTGSNDVCPYHMEKTQLSSLCIESKVFSIIMNIG